MDSSTKNESASYHDKPLSSMGGLSSAQGSTPPESDTVHSLEDQHLPQPDTSLRAWIYLTGVWVIEAMLWGQFFAPCAFKNVNQE